MQLLLMPITLAFPIYYFIFFLLPLYIVGNYALSNWPKAAEPVRGKAWELELQSPLSLL